MKIEITKEQIEQWAGKAGFWVKDWMGTAMLEVAQRATDWAIEQREAELLGVGMEPVAQLTVDDDSYWYDPLTALAVLFDGTHKLYTATQLAAARLQGAEDQRATIVRLIDTIKYMVNIAERGTGKKCSDDETPERFLLAYVKHLENEVHRLDAGWHSANGMALDKSLQYEQRIAELESKLAQADKNGYYDGDTVDMLHKRITDLERVNKRLLGALKAIVQSADQDMAAVNTFLLIDAKNATAASQEAKP